MIEFIRCENEHDGILLLKQWKPGTVRIVVPRSKVELYRNAAGYYHAGIEAFQSIPNKPCKMTMEPDHTGIYITDLFDIRDYVLGLYPGLELEGNDVITADGFKVIGGDYINGIWAGFINVGGAPVISMTSKYRGAGSLPIAWESFIDELERFMKYKSALLIRQGE